ncbi:potassium transporter TrkG [Candidatus Mycoplasma pogonae]
MYFLITIIGSLLLNSRVSQKEGADVYYVDALFTAASAFSDTGLTTKVTSSTWSEFGQAVISILILIGGIGFFALKIYFINWLFGRRLTIFSREVLNVERGSYQTGKTKTVVVVSINILFTFILVSTIFLTLFFYFSDANFEPEANISESPQGNFGLAFKFGIFHSISALNNAGFDIMGSHSIAPYYHSYFLQIWLILLFVFGGIGYPVIYDLYTLAIAKFWKKTKYQVSLFTKLSLLMYAIVAVVGLLLIFLFEATSLDPTTFWNREAGSEIHWNYSYGSKGDKVMAVFFNVFATRSAGFYTVDFYNFTSPSIMIFTIMMLIGGAPSSTAGGFRTTTMAIIFLGLWSKLTSKPTVRAFKRKISDKKVFDALIVFFLSLLLIFFGTLIVHSSSAIYYNEGGLITYDEVTKLPTNQLAPLIEPIRQYEFIHVLFDVTSAFGTTGISTGIQPYLNTVSRITLILIMFIGQLGISSTILVWANNNSRSIKFDYPEEDVLIG